MKSLLNFWGKTNLAVLILHCMGQVTKHMNNCVIIREDMRKRGFGAQLIGQAVYQTRALGGDTLRVFLQTEDPAKSFFEDCGFEAQYQEAEGSVWVKDIRFNPEFL